MVEFARHVDEPALPEQPRKLAHVVVADRYASELHVIEDRMCVCISEVTG